MKGRDLGEQQGTARGHFCDRHIEIVITNDSVPHFQWPEPNDRAEGEEKDKSYHLFREVRRLK